MFCKRCLAVKITRLKKTHKIVRRPQGSGFQSSHVCVLLLILKHTFFCMLMLMTNVDIDDNDDIDVQGGLWL